MRFHCSGTVVVVGILLVVALRWHCNDKVVSVVLTVLIVVALAVWWSLLVSQDGVCDGVWSSRDFRTVRFLM